MTCVLVQKVQSCLERISSASILINLGGSNVLGYCAALVLRALLPNERNGSVTLGEEPDTSGSPTTGAVWLWERCTSLFLILCTSTWLYLEWEKNYAIFSCLRELHQSQIGLHIHKKTARLWVGSMHAHMTW